LGNQFVVNVKAGIDYIKVDRLDQTVDYEVMLQIIKSEFAKPTPLLEELAHRIEQAI
jgi:dihydroneopterin aldolase